MKDVVKFPFSVCEKVVDSNSAYYTDIALAGYTRNAVVFWASSKLTLILAAEDTLLMSVLLLIENVQNGFS